MRRFMNAITSAGRNIRSRFVQGVSNLRSRSSAASRRSAS